MPKKVLSLKFISAGQLETAFQCCSSDISGSAKLMADIVHSLKKLITHNSLLITARRRRAFTLIEVLVVITIISVLTGTVYVAVNKVTQGSRDQKRKENLKTLSTALTAYYLDNDKYPPIAGATALSFASDGTWPPTDLTTDYIPKVPKDPRQASANIIQLAGTWKDKTVGSAKSLASTIASRKIFQKILSPPVAEAANTIAVTSCSITEADSTSVAMKVGQNIKVTATIRNDGASPISSQGPYTESFVHPTFAYNEGSTYTTISPSHPSDTGKFRMGLDLSGSLTYPHRWGWGSTTQINPGQSVTITGYVRLTTATNRTLQIGIVEEGVLWHAQNLCTTSITVSTVGSSDLSVFNTTDFKLQDASGADKTSFTTAEDIYPYISVRNFITNQTSTTAGYFFIDFYSYSTSNVTIAAGTRSNIGVWAKVYHRINGFSNKPYSKVDRNEVFHNDGTNTDHWRITTPGTYYARFYIDPTNFVSESSDINNQHYWNGTAYVVKEIAYTVVSSVPLSSTPSDPSPNVGQTFTFTASGGDNMNYSWDTDNDGAFDDGLGTTISVTFTTTGPHTVRVLSAGQTFSYTVNIDYPAPICSGPFTAEVNQQISLSASSGDGTNYSWSVLPSAGASPSTFTGNPFLVTFTNPTTPRNITVTSDDESDTCTVEIGVTSPFAAGTACNNKPTLYFYCYMVSSDRKQFILWAKLENSNDSQIYTNSAASCKALIPSDTNTATFTLNYCVENLK